MKFGPTNRRCFAAKRARAGFTLAEVLAALVFMAIVIPVAVEGLSVASRAGQVAQRKMVAARIADRMLNDLLVTGQWQASNQSGQMFDGANEYTWRAETLPWELGVLHLLEVEVLYSVRGQLYDVRLSTLVDPSAEQTSTNATTTATMAGGTP